MTDFEGSRSKTCYAAIDLSKSKWVVAIDTGNALKPAVHVLPGFDTAGLLNLLSASALETVDPSEQPADVVVCYESGYDGFWLQRLLTAEGHRAIVFDPVSFPVNRRAKQAKTDKIDAKQMVRFLKTWVESDPTICTAIRIPSPEEEDAKRFHRERGALVAERTRLAARCRALLALEGVHDISPLAVTHVHRLDGLTTHDGRPFPVQKLAEVRRVFRRIKFINELIREVDAERDEAVQKNDARFPETEKALQLERIKGIGRYSACLLASEIYHRDFTNRKQLASYLGLTPTPRASGDVEKCVGIDKAGNKIARTLLVELAWNWLRFQPDSALSKWYRTFTATRAPASKKIAIVALARKIAVALWRYVGSGLIPTGVVMKAEA